MREKYNCTLFAFEYLSVRKLSADIVANILCGSQVGSASLGALNGQRGGPFHVPSQPPSPPS